MAVNVTVEMKNSAHVSALKQVCDRSAETLKCVCLGVTIMKDAEEGGTVFTMKFGFETQRALDDATPTIKASVRGNLDLVAPDALIQDPVADMEPAVDSNVLTAGSATENLFFLATIMVLHFLL